MAAVIVTRVIKMVGLNMILYIAALQSIPRDYEEAARLEGASRWQIFRMIIWPLLAPTTLVIMVITTIGSFKVFDHIYQMTGGGPENGTLVLAYYIYQQGFEFFNVGYASALAMIMFVIVMALTIVQVMLRRRGIGMTQRQIQILYRTCWTIALLDRRHPVRLSIPVDGVGRLQERRPRSSARRASFRASGAGRTSSRCSPTSRSRGSISIRSTSRWR